MSTSSAKTIRKKKNAPKFSSKSGVRKLPRKKHREFVVSKDEIKRGWMVAGFDTALSGIAGAAFAYDAGLKQMKGPVFIHYRFGPDDDYFERLKFVASAKDLMFDLTSALNVFLPLEDIYICQEEPFPAHTGFTKRGGGQSLKQQAEISGAFLGGLVKWGYTNIVQVSNQHWRQNVAAQISESTGEDVTIYPQKWKSGALASRFGCKPDDSGKFRVVQWAHDVWEPWIAQQGGIEIPQFPHMITRDGRKIPKPEDSKAKPFQPDDCYDALAIADWLRVDQELTNG